MSGTCLFVASRRASRRVNPVPRRQMRMRRRRPTTSFPASSSRSKPVFSPQRLLCPCALRTLAHSRVCKIPAASVIPAWQFAWLRSLRAQGRVALGQSTEMAHCKQLHPHLRSHRPAQELFSWYVRNNSPKPIRTPTDLKRGPYQMQRQSFNPSTHSTTPASFFGFKGRTSSSASHSASQFTSQSSSQLASYPSSPPSPLFAIDREMEPPDANRPRATQAVVIHTSMSVSRAATAQLTKRKGNR